MVADAWYPQPVYELRYVEYRNQRRLQIARADLESQFYRLPSSCSTPEDNPTAPVVFVEYADLKLFDL
jgi:hypothetical protein